MADICTYGGMDITKIYTSTGSRVLAKYPCPVEWGLSVLNVTGLQHAASLGV